LSTDYTIYVSSLMNRVEESPVISLIFRTQLQITININPALLPIYQLFYNIFY